MIAPQIAEVARFGPPYEGPLTAEERRWLVERDVRLYMEQQALGKVQDKTDYWYRCGIIDHEQNAWEGACRVARYLAEFYPDYWIVLIVWLTRYCVMHPLEKAEDWVLRNGERRFHSSISQDREVTG